MAYGDVVGHSGAERYKMIDRIDFSQIFSVFSKPNFQRG